MRDRFLDDLMAIPESVRDILEEFAQAQLRPITNHALVERMRSESTTWINAAYMEHRRAKHPLVDPESAGDEAWRQEIDLHFLLVALTRLRRAVGLVTRVEELRERLVDHLIQFDRNVPSLRTLRNVAEHFDDYTVGSGRVTQVKRHQLQAWSLVDDADRGLVWRWLDHEFAIDLAIQAATQLYRGFLADAEDYLAKDR